MRKILALAPALLLAGCNSAQVVMQPVAPVAESLAATTPAVPYDSALTATITARRLAATAKPLLLPVPLVAVELPVLPASAPQPLKAPNLRAVTRLATRGSTAPAVKRLSQRIQRQRPTEGAAESGLGGIALFAVGVVLAVLAGLAALVNVIFNLGFFTALGYTAAGLVVLVLLYVLFSKGKKKK
ncbi:MAG: hypothetical protein EOO56_18170 [Hymenobacter sp.]|nr:MAG: hypothetical protein EOO56_18170 [Hymenobacter sp.]